MLPDAAHLVLNCAMMPHQSSCRQMLYQLHQLLSASSQASSQDVQDFKRLLWAAHLTCLANQSLEAGLLELAARQLTALLHYIGIVPADRWGCVCLIANSTRASTASRP